MPEPRRIHQYRSGLQQLVRYDQSHEIVSTFRRRPSPSIATGSAMRSRSLESGVPTTRSARDMYATVRNCLSSLARLLVWMFETIPYLRQIKHCRLWRQLLS